MKNKNEIVLSKSYPKILKNILNQCKHWIPKTGCNDDLIANMEDTLEEMNYIEKNCIIVKK